MFQLTLVIEVNRKGKSNAQKDIKVMVTMMTMMVVTVAAKMIVATMTMMVVQY